MLNSRDELSSLTLWSKTFYHHNILCPEINFIWFWYCFFLNHSTMVSHFHPFSFKLFLSLSGFLVMEYSWAYFLIQSDFQLRCLEHLHLIWTLIWLGLWVHWPLYIIKCTSLSLIPFLALKSTRSDVSRAIPVILIFLLSMFWGPNI